MKLSWFIYVLIGMGIASSEPFAAEPYLTRAAIGLAWPSVIARDTINGAYLKAGRDALAKESAE